MQRLKNYKNNRVFILSLILLLGSCKARFYTPNRNPVPLFRESGELYVDASMNMINKVDLTVGTAVSDNIGAYIGYGGSAQNFGSDTSVGTTKYRYNGKMLNLGVGYFVNQNQSETFRFEVFGDFAYGSFRNKVTGTNNAFFNGNFTRVGIMPNIGFRSSDDAFSIAYSARFSQLRLFGASVSDSGFWSSDIRRYNYSPSYLMIEHAINLRFGGEKFKFQLQTALYQGLNADETGKDNSAIPFTNFAIMVGVVYNMYFKQ